MSELKGGRSKKNDISRESTEVDVDQILTKDSRTGVFKKTKISEEESETKFMTDAIIASKKRIFDLDVDHQRFKDQMQMDKDSMKANFERDKIRLSKTSKRGHDALDKLTKEETKRHNERMQMYKCQ